MKTPPLIIATALLFWGVEMHLIIPAAFMATAVEASRLIKHRWDVTESDFRRISILCTLALVSIAVYRLLTGWFSHPAWMIFKWLPVIVLPLFLAQLYSTRGRVSLSVLFLFVRKRVATGQAKPQYIDLSYSYLAICVFAAGFANNRDGLFYIALMVFAGWALWAFRSRRLPIVLWGLLILVAAGAGYLGQIGLTRLQTIVEHKTTQWYFNPGEGPYRRYSQIGEIGDDKLSNRIVFRARPGGTDERSLLLRESTYDQFRSIPPIWSDSKKKFNRLQKKGQDGSWQLAPVNGGVRNCTIAQHLRGNDALLKLPSGTFQIDNLKAFKVEQNEFGTLKVKGNGLATYRVRYGDDSPLESPPNAHDLIVPERESKVVKEIAQKLNLHRLPPSQALETVKTYFMTRYTYSLKQSSKSWHLSPVVNFLTNTQSGHCEFFASATVMLLREAGIPARYARGYAVVASDKMGGWNLIRARYAHAWVVAYVDNAWVNLDTTPGTWAALERQAESIWEQYQQRLVDVLSAGMFQISQWRQEMQARGYFNYLPWLLLPVGIWVSFRIVAKFKLRPRSQKTRVAQSGQKWIPAGSDSDFYRIEQRLNELGSERYPWETYSAWLDRIEKTARLKLSLEIPRESMALHYRYRFDPLGIDGADKARMTSMIATWLTESDPDLQTQPHRC